MNANAPSHVDSDLTGVRFADRYRILDKLGEGGIGVVSRAYDEVRGCDVALKQLLSNRAGARRRKVEALFEREYHTLVRLKHPRIIEVYEYGLAETGPYYTMELLDGQDLNTLGELPYREACKHLRDVTSSLALIHAHRLVHRDVSPRNVRISSNGAAKLLDFGALAPFGPVSDVMGTPLCLAPEALRAQMVDQRTDLFSLGTVAYFVLTGHHAYPVRALEDLHDAWCFAPRPPSYYQPEIPEALDRLVLSLLSLEPLGRPQHAAAVIDQLTAIAGLPPEEHELTAASYLSSTRMVGREAELAWCAARVARAAEGAGAEIVIEGAVGIGKSRLLHDMGVEALLKGVVVLRADGQATPEPFGVAATLVSAYAVHCPEITRRTIAPYAPLLAHLSDVVREGFAPSTLATLPIDPSERRARLQTALHDWFVAIAGEKTLLLAVDNLQDADDNSAAFLAALGHEARKTKLIVAISLRSVESAPMSAPLRMLRQRASRLKLGGLSVAACEDLVKSLFGETAHTGRVASLLYNKSAGVPQQCMDLARLLVKKNIARYTGGGWVLPASIGDDELPTRGSEIVAARIDNLGEAARSLAELLSIEAKPVALDRCLHLLDGGSEVDLYAALDELVAEQVLICDAGSYRFRQRALRDALSDSLSEEKRRGHHTRAADTLLAVTDCGLDQRAEAAWHLLQAGEAARGSAILADAGRQIVTGATLHDSSDQVTDALQRALRMFQQTGKSDYEIAALMLPLISISFFSASWRFVVEYGEQAIALGLKITGLSLGQKLRPYLGRRVALIVCLIVASIRFSRQRRRGLPYDLKEAIGWICAIVPAVAGTAAIHLDRERARRIRDAVEPLSLFGEGEVPTLMRDYAVAQSVMLRGDLLQAKLLFEKQRAAYHQPKVLALLGDGQWKAIYGGVLFVLGILESYRFGGGATKYADDIVALEYRVWAMAADQLSLLHHAFRGESTRVQYFRELVDRSAIQGNTTWQVEVFWPAILLNADALSGDVIAARHTWEQLTRRAKDIPALAMYAKASHAVYLTLRGELSAAIDIYQEVMRSLGDGGGVASLPAFFAQALNAAGQHDRAKSLCDEWSVRMPAPGADFPMLHLELARQRALADLGLGQHAAAAQQIDVLLAQHAEVDHPLMIGLLHEARTLVALAQHDEAAAAAHLLALQACFRPTENAALITRSDRMARQVKLAGYLVVDNDTAFVPKSLRSLGSHSVAEISAAADPVRQALSVVIRQLGAKSGYLYLVSREGLRLKAASGSEEPPSGLETELRARLERRELAIREEALAMLAMRTESLPSMDVANDVEPHARASITGSLRPADAGLGAPGSASAPPSESAEPAAGSMSVFAHSVPPPVSNDVYKLVLLETRRGETAIAVGGMILESCPELLSYAQTEFLDHVANALYDRVSFTQDSLG